MDTIRKWIERGYFDTEDKIVVCDKLHRVYYCGYVMDVPIKYIDIVYSHTDIQKIIDIEYREFII